MKKCSIENDNTCGICKVTNKNICKDDIFKDKVIFISGGTGFLGRNLVKYYLKTDCKKIIIFSRDEHKQYYMQNELKDDRLRFIIGDLRDSNRLNIALKNVDICIHAGALKQVPIITYNPFEAVMTNIIGTKNIIETCCSNHVEKLIYISSDKANEPVNLYGASKFCAEQLIQNGYVYSENYKTKMICVRYGNIAGSTGSIIPLFKKLIVNGEKMLPLTDINMTRFWFDIQGAIDLINLAIDKGNNQEIYIPKLKSFKIVDLITAMNYNYEIVGIRQGEKLFEKMINEHERFKEYENYFVVSPKCQKTNFEYRSDINVFMTIAELKKEINKN